MESNTRNHLATPVRGPSAKCHVSKVPAGSIGAGRSIGTEVEWNVDGIQVETHQLCSHHQLTSLVLFFLSSHWQLCCLLGQGTAQSPRSPITQNTPGRLSSVRSAAARPIPNTSSGVHVEPGMRRRDEDVKLEAYIPNTPDWNSYAP